MFNSTEIYHTFGTQIEILPRVTIIYRHGDDPSDPIDTGFALEWLWFGVFVGVGNAKPNPSLP
jgi:hypothetical protein